MYWLSGYLGLGNFYEFFQNLGFFGWFRGIGQFMEKSVVQSVELTRSKKVLMTSILVNNNHLHSKFTEKICSYDFLKVRAISEGVAKVPRLPLVFLG